MLSVYFRSINIVMLSLLSSVKPRLFMVTLCAGLGVLNPALLFQKDIQSLFHKQRLKQKSYYRSFKTEMRTFENFFYL